MGEKNLTAEIQLRGHNSNFQRAIVAELWVVCHGDTFGSNHCHGECLSKIYFNSDLINRSV